MSLVFLLPDLKAAAVHWVRIDLGMEWDLAHLSPSQRTGRQSMVGLAEVASDNSEELCLEQVFFATCFGGYS